jgi:hypothetical protein
MKLRRISQLASTAHGLSSSVRNTLKVRALQSLTIALDGAVSAGRAGEPLTINRFVEVLAERWSEIYRETRRKCDTGKLNDFKPETVRSIREELVGTGIALHKIWNALKRGVPGLFDTSAPKRSQGRIVYIEDDDRKTLPLLARFDEILAVDARYRRQSAGTRVLSADNDMPPRKIARRVAGERPYDVMHIGQQTEDVLQRLEAARVLLNVGKLVADIQRAKAELGESTWPATRRDWRRRTRKRGLRGVALKRAWKNFMEARDRHSERARYNSRLGRLRAMQAIYDELQERGLVDHQNVEIKSAFYKSRTRRFQARNVWPSEASSGIENRIALPGEMQASLLEIARLMNKLEPGRYTETTKAPSELVIPQRMRWFKVLDPVLDAPWQAADAGTVDLVGLDVSGSQAQILAVLMGLRDVEDDLRKMAFKKIVAASALALHRDRKIKLPADLISDHSLLEENAKAAMKLLYGASEKSLADKGRLDPDKYGSGLALKTLGVLFKKTPIIARLRQYLDVCKAVGESACAMNPAAGVTVVDPLDGTSFTWNPPIRRKKPVPSGSFTLYCWPPVQIRTGPQAGEYKVDKGKLRRRIAPGLIQMLDALYAAIVVVLLNAAGIKDVIAIHDAFLVPGTRPAREGLEEALHDAGRIWLPKLGPVYDFFENYLPAETEYGRLVREWRAAWDQRVQAGDSPNFRTKYEGSELR